MVFPDKAIRYIVPANDTRERILRKLNYLIAYTQGQRRTEGKP
jgi:hypothetical protein